jgi:hypothetical protein
MICLRIRRPRSGACATLVYVCRPSMAPGDYARIPRPPVILHAAALTADSCPAGKLPIGPVSPIGMKALSSSGDEPRPHQNVGSESPGHQTPGYQGTLDRRPRHSNVQPEHVNIQKVNMRFMGFILLLQSPPPPPPPLGQGSLPASRSLPRGLDLCAAYGPQVPWDDTILSEVMHNHHLSLPSVRLATWKHDGYMTSTKLSLITPCSTHPTLNYHFQVSSRSHP